MLRRALAEASRQLRLAHSDAGAMVDRRIVTKLLVTYFERGRGDQDVLGLMARMLGFTGVGAANPVYSRSRDWSPRIARSAYGTAVAISHAGRLSHPASSLSCCFISIMGC